MIYFLSDAHLGSLMITNPSEHQDRFVRLLGRMEEDADEVYLLGDIFDFWVEYHYRTTTHFDHLNPALDAIANLAKKCPVHFFIGNHDMWTYGWLEKRTGVILHRAPLITDLQGKKCYLAHGDGLGSQDRVFLCLRRIFRNPILRLLFGALPPAFGDKLGYGWSASSRKKEMAHPHPYMGEQKEDLLRFAREEEAKHPERHINYYIFGHRHIELTYPLPTRACVYILGDFFEQFTYATMEDGRLTMHALRANGQ